MTPVINNVSGEGSNSATGLLIGIIALIIVVALFLVYVLPEIRNSGESEDGSIDVNITLPGGDNAPDSAPQQ